MKTETLPGHPLYRRSQEYGNGLRTKVIAQPGTLRPGDVLATGEKVLSEPRGGKNGSVLVHIADGQWYNVPPELPIALKDQKVFAKPGELKQGDTIVTGEKVLLEPIIRQENGSVLVFLSGVPDDQIIDVPNRIPIALKAK